MYGAPSQKQWPSWLMHARSRGERRVWHCHRPFLSPLSHTKCTLASITAAVGSKPLHLVVDPRSSDGAANGEHGWARFRPVDVVRAASAGVLCAHSAALGFNTNDDRPGSAGGSGGVGSAGALPTSAESRAAQIQRQKELFAQRRSGQAAGGTCTPL